MSLLITDEILNQANMSEEQFKLELAIFLFQREVFTLGKASAFAGIHSFQLQKILSERKISIHYGEDDLEKDIQTIKRL
ncbi:MULTISPECIES: UPF0175 family protein [unclassified Imperialibacter]|uniref:UPF0175 family protein n=1 Tax=unclassified Imperialibacter TaxID=2629706 RepID=UPI00125F7359|nr:MULTISPECIES: UPF0175 family protein [unclassified Imperialibacter]